jgi:hypothetical protein
VATQQAGRQRVVDTETKFQDPWRPGVRVVQGSSMKSSVAIISRAFAGLWCLPACMTGSCHTCCSSCMNAMCAQLYKQMRRPWSNTAHNASRVEQHAAATAPRCRACKSQQALGYPRTCCPVHKGHLRDVGEQQATELMRITPACDSADTTCCASQSYWNQQAAICQWQLHTGIPQLARKSLTLQYSPTTQLVC